MGLPRKLLGADERVVIHVRTHAKALLGPFVVLLVAVLVTAAAAAYRPASWPGWSTAAILVLAVLVVLVRVAWPFLQWRSSTYTVTDRRVITRHGVITKTGHDLPLSRVNNVTYERGLLDRMLGCGTLVLTTAAESPLVLPDIPDVETVHVTMTELLFGSPASRDPND